MFWFVLILIAVSILIWIHIRIQIHICKHMNSNNHIRICIHMHMEIIIRIHGNPRFVFLAAFASSVVFVFIFIVIWILRWACMCLLMLVFQLESIRPFTCILIQTTNTFSFTCLRNTCGFTHCKKKGPAFKHRKTRKSSSNVWLRVHALPHNKHTHTSIQIQGEQTLINTLMGSTKTNQQSY